jgi:hypothetical protein
MLQVNLVSPSKPVAPLWCVLLKRLTSKLPHSSECASSHAPCKGATERILLVALALGRQELVAARAIRYLSHHDFPKLA